MDYQEHELLLHLAGRYGIAPDYHDIWGQRHETSDDTRRAILSAMGVQADTADAIRRALAALDEAPWRRACEPVRVARVDAPAGVWPVRVPSQESEDRSMAVAWIVRDEAGAVVRRQEAGPNLAPHETRLVGGLRHVRFDLPLPDGLPVGYYELSVKIVSDARQVEGAMRLIVAPPTCYRPPEFEQGQRLWGLAVQLYALRSARNWGAGDFGDLAACVEWAAKDLGAGMIGLNPLHALNNRRPYEISPYSPASRLFINLLYLDLEAVPDYECCPPAQQMVRDAGFQRALTALRAGDKVDYEQVASAKRAALELLFGAFHERHLGGRDLQAADLRPATTRGQAFADYVKREGEPLELFALFQTLTEEMRRQHPLIAAWREWPEPYRLPGSASVAAFRVTHRARIRYHQYVQWLAEEQLSAVASRARALGMPVGLYHDLALGSDRNGSDAWAYQEAFALGSDCGCPPDDFAPQGQNWGLPPVDPVRLREQGYGFFIELLRRNLRHGGALRLDHVMSLFRLFWIPCGMPASAGAYVSYPAEDLLGILALESVRQRTVIIGEDLGTVPDIVRERLAAACVLSYRVLYFERADPDHWRMPEAWPRAAMAVATTHDLPTLAGFWSGRDLDVRARLGLYRDEGVVQRAREGRARDKRHLVQALKEAGFLPAGLSEELAIEQPMTPELCRAFHALLARAPSWVALANLEDLLGETEQMNVPGTVEAYANWSRKVAMTLEQLRDDARVHRAAAALRAERPLPE
jgi:4-alpha-glucanotransferase